MTKDEVLLASAKMFEFLMSPNGQISYEIARDMARDCRIALEQKTTYDDGYRDGIKMIKRYLDRCELWIRPNPLELNKETI